MRSNIGSISCSFCQAATRPTTLGQFGNRCATCYRAYCDQGLHGGPKGFEGGAADTEQQRTIRQGLKGNRPTGHYMGPEDEREEAAARELAKQKAARAVATYQRAPR